MSTRQLFLPETESLTETAISVELPDLNGSEKQVRWAGHIRREKLREVQQVLREWQGLIDNYQRAGKSLEKVAEARAAFRSALDGLEALEKQASAAWWIDRREKTARELLGETG